MSEKTPAYGGKFAVWPETCMFQSWDTSLTCAGYTKYTDTLQKVCGWGKAGKREVCSPCLPWEKVLKAEGGCALTIRVCWAAEDTVEVRIQKRNKELPKRLLAFMSLSPQAPRACTGKGSWSLPKAGCPLACVIVSLLGQEARDTAELLCVPRDCKKQQPLSPASGAADEWDRPEAQLQVIKAELYPSCSSWRLLWWSLGAPF